MKDKKKAAEILKEIDSDLDTVLSILTKLGRLSPENRKRVDKIIGKKHFLRTGGL